MRYAWALLLARIYEVFPLICPKCGGKMKIIAFTIEGEAVREITVDFGWQVQRYVIECGWISYPQAWPSVRINMVPEKGFGATVTAAADFSGVS